MNWMIFFYSFIFLLSSIVPVVHSLDSSSASSVVESLFIAKQPSTEAHVGKALPLQPIVQLRDAKNLVVSGQGRRVVRASLIGPGILYGTTAITTDDGIATFTDLTIVGKVDKYHLSFSVSGLASVSSEKPTLLLPGTVASMAWVSEPPITATSGEVFADVARIVLLDAGRNPAQHSFNNLEQHLVTVKASLVESESGSGQLLGSLTQQVVDSSHVAFTDLSIVGKVSRRYHIRFQIDGLAPLESASISLVAGKPHALEIAKQPAQSARVGELLNVPPSVRLVDASGNLVSLDSKSVVVAELIVTNKAAATPSLQGSSSQLALGIATFNHLRIFASTGAVKLRFYLQDDPKKQTISQAMDLRCGVAASMTLASPLPSSSVGAGALLSNQPIIQLRDQAGNVASDDYQTSIRVSIGKTPANNAPRIMGTRELFARGGVVQFTNLAIVAPVGDYILHFASDHLPDKASHLTRPITVTRGPPQALFIQDHPPLEAAVGLPFVQQPRVVLLDAGGNHANIHYNLTENGSYTVTATLSSGAGSITGSSAAVVDEQGVAKFTNLGLVGIAATNGYRLGFVSSLGLTPVECENMISLVAGHPVALVLSTDTPKFVTAVVGSPLPHVFKVYARDLAHNRVSTGKFGSVSVAAVGVTTSNNNTTALPHVQGDIEIEPTVLTEDGCAVASFSNLKIIGSVDIPVKLQFESPNLPPLLAETVISLTAGRPHSLAIVHAGSQQARVGKELSVQPSVEIRDEGGNRASREFDTVIEIGLDRPVNDATVSLSGTLQTVTVGGIAQFTNLVIVAPTSTSLIFRFSALTPGINPILSPTPCVVVAGPATSMSVLVAPSSEAYVGIVFQQQPVIATWDAAGNRADSDDSIVVTASICAGPGALEGTTTVRSTRGQAQFTDLALVGIVAESSYRLHFRSNTGLITEDASHLTSLRPGHPAAMALNGSVVVATAACGELLDPQPAIVLLDMAGNPYTGGVYLDDDGNDDGGSTGRHLVTRDNRTPPRVSIGARIHGSQSNATLRGTTNVEASLVLSEWSSSNNKIELNYYLVAAFTDLSISGSVGDVASLEFYSPSSQLARPTLHPEGMTRILPGRATHMQMIQEPTTIATVGQVLPKQPVLQLLDSAGNFAAGDSTTVIAAHHRPLSPSQTSSSTSTASSGGKPLSNQHPKSWFATASWGVVRFTDIALVGKAGNPGHSLHFTSSSPSVSPMEWNGTIRLQPGPAVRLEMGIFPSETAIVDVPLSRQPSVVLVDAGGNRASSQSGLILHVELVSGDASLQGASDQRSISGEAEFMGLAIVGIIGSYWLRFSGGPSLPQLQCQTEIRLSAGAPVKLSMLVNLPVRSVVGEALSPQPKVVLHDAGGNIAVSSSTVVTAVLSSGPGILMGDASVQTGADGVASFSNLALFGTAFAGYQLYFITNISGMAPLHPFGDITLAAGIATKAIRSSSPKITAIVGRPMQPFPPTFRLYDAAGNLATNGPAVWMKAKIKAHGDDPSPPSLSGEIDVAAASGECSFGSLVIIGVAGRSYTVEFVSKDVLVAASDAIEVVLSAGEAVSMHVGKEPAREAKLGIALPQQPSILLKDAGGNLAVDDSGKTVTASLLTAGEGSLLGTTVVTSCGGLAKFTDLTLIGKAVGYKLLFTSGQDLLPVKSTETIRLRSGDTAGMALGRSSAAFGTVGTALSQQPTILLRDVGGNTATDDHSTVVTAKLILPQQSSSSASSAVVTYPQRLGGSTEIIAAGGIVAFTDLSIHAAVGEGYRLKFQSLSIPGTVSLLADVLISVVAGQTASLVIAKDPSAAAVGSLQIVPATAVVGLPLDPQPKLWCVDAGGNLAVGDSQTVVSASVHPPHAILQSATAVSQKGVVGFTNLSMVGPAKVSYVLHFAAPGLSPIHSPGFILEAGDAVSMVIMQEPSQFAKCGAVLNRQPIIRLLDAAGNGAAFVSHSRMEVTASIRHEDHLNSHSSSVIIRGIGDNNAPTAEVSGGVVVFNGLRLEGPAGISVRLSFSSSSFGTAVSSNKMAGSKEDMASSIISITPGDPARLLIHRQPPTTARSGRPFSHQPCVRILDIANNTVHGDHSTLVWIDLVSRGGSGMIIGSREARADGGLATFSNLGIEGPAGTSVKLQFSSPSLPDPITSQSLQLVAGNPTKMQITTEPSSTAAVGVPLSQQPALMLLDHSGNVVDSDNVTVVHAVLVAGSGSIKGNISVTASVGAVAFTDLYLIGNSATSFHLHFLSAGIPPLHSDTWISLVPGKVASLAMAEHIGHMTAVVGQPLSQHPVVQLQDLSGNVVTSDSNSEIVVSVLSGEEEGKDKQRENTTNNNNNNKINHHQLLGKLSVRVSSGVATFLDLRVMGPASRVVKLSFQVENLPGIAPLLCPTRIVLTAGLVAAHTASPSLLGIAVQPPEEVSVGQPFAVQPRVLLRDAGGNVAIGDRHTAVTASLVLEGTGVGAGVSSSNTVSSSSASSVTNLASLQGSLEVVSIGGLATFTDLRIVGKSSSMMDNARYKLVFRVGSAMAASTVESNPIALKPWTPTSLALDVDLSSDASFCNRIVSRQPIVSLRDGWGNLVSGVAGAKITASLDHGSAELVGTVTTCAESGRAVFTDLRVLGSVGSSYSMRFVSNLGLPQLVSSAAVRVLPGDPVSLSIETEPAHWAECGVAVPVQPKIRFVDACGNFASVSQHVVVRAQLLGDYGNITLGEQALAVAGASAAAFEDLSISGPCQLSYGIVFQSANLLSVESISIISLRAGIAATMTFGTALPKTSIANEVFVRHLVINLFDKCGNKAKDSGIDIRIELLQPLGSGLTVGGDTIARAHGGKAEFVQVRITGKGRGQQVQAMFSAPNLPPLISDHEITVVAGDEHDEL